MVIRTVEISQDSDIYSKTSRQAIKFLDEAVGFSWPILKTRSDLSLAIAFKDSVIIKISKASILSSFL